MLPVNADTLRERYFELSNLCKAEIDKGTVMSQLEVIKTEMGAIIRLLNEMDGRQPSDLILD